MQGKLKRCETSSRGVNGNGKGGGSDQGEVGDLALGGVALLPEVDHRDDLHQQPLEVGREVLGDRDRRLPGSRLMHLQAHVGSRGMFCCQVQRLCKEGEGEGFCKPLLPALAAEVLKPITTVLRYCFR